MVDKYRLEKLRKNAMQRRAGPAQLLTVGFPIKLYNPFSYLNTKCCKQSTLREPLRKRQRTLQQQQGRGKDSDDDEDPGAVPTATEQRPTLFDAWVNEYSQQTPSWATSIIHGQKDQQAQIAELIRVLQTSTMIASKHHGGVGPSSTP
ncbi:hypothetical protein LWI28_024426 [Acer negundo]|uniref:Uncharacterized protein n=1 Tax=Acer negundo TaxID=4023 RepID=A0AAD5NYL9_ACENE|nr:hypothetical protein LWI28_024426 [Acer negundo]